MHSSSALDVYPSKLAPPFAHCQHTHPPRLLCYVVWILEEDNVRLADLVEH